MATEQQPGSAVGPAASNELIRLALTYSDALDRCTRTGGENIDEVINQIRLTFDEDRVVIEKQFRNMREFAQRAEWMDIHVDVGANRARRIVQRLAQPQAAVP